MNDRERRGFWIAFCGFGAAICLSSISARADCSPAAPNIVTDSYTVLRRGVAVGTYTDNVQFDPAIDDTLRVQFRGFSNCTDGGTWDRGPLYVQIDGGAGNIVNIQGGQFGCSGLQQSELVSDPFNPNWAQLGPGPHAFQIVGHPADASCNGVEVKSREVIVWVKATLGGGDGTYGFEGNSCQRAEIAHPVNLASGKMHTEMTDLAIQGPLPIVFERRFDSKSSDDLAMGYGWQHTFMQRIIKGDLATTFVDGEMRRVKFNCAVGDQNTGKCLGVWHPNHYDHLTLAQGTNPPWRITDNHGKSMEFDTSGRLVRVQDRNGNWISVAYDDAGSTVTDSAGRSLVIATSGGRVDHITAGNRTISYVYDTNPGSEHNLLEVWETDTNTPLRKVVTYAYDSASHRLRTATDANGHVIESHDYRSDGKVTHTESDGGNNAYSIQYPSTTQTTVTNALGVMTTYTIDPFSGFATDRTGGPGCASCGDAGDATHQVFDAALNRTDITDGLGVTTHMTYDAMGNILTRTEAKDTGDQRTGTYTYDPTWNFPTTITVPSVGTCSNANAVTTLTYDTSNGDLLSEEVTGCDDSVAFDRTRTYSYNGHGQLQTSQGPRAEETTVYLYYSTTNPLVPPEKRGRLKSVTNALGQVTRYNSYDYFGNVLSVTDLNNVETTFAYDLKDRVTEKRIKGTTSADDFVTTYVYDTVGNLTNVRLPDCVAAGTGCANSIQYGYDHVNRLNEIDDAVGNKVIYTYDSEGNRTREEYRDSLNAIQKFTNFKYDTFNRLQYAYFTSTVPENTGSIFYKYAYYADGTRQFEQDPLGHVTSFAYDGLKRLQSVTQTVAGNDLITSYTYDIEDGLTSVTDPNNLQTTYTNGDEGWRLSAVSPDTGTTTYAYDDSGNLLSSTDAMSITVSRAYDELNRPTTVTFGTDATLSVENSYDSTSVSFGIGRRTGLTDASGASVFGYDRRGLLTSEQKTIGGVTYTTGYTFDKTGNLTELRFPTNSPADRQGVVDYAYDFADRVTGVTTTLNGTQTTIANGFQYEPFGPRAQMTLHGALTDTRTYDTRYRLSTWTLGNLLSYTHTYFDDDTLHTRTDNLNAANNRTFGYDEIHRLTTADGPWGSGSLSKLCAGGTKTYFYDFNGNRLCKGESVTATHYTYTPGTNRLASSTGGEAASYGYNNNGNITNDGMHSYTYNQAGRLATVDTPPIATYTYDGENRRALKIASATTTDFLYDPSGRLIQEYVPATGNGKDYIYVHDAPLARVDWSVTQQGSGTVVTNALFYYHTDHLGTPIAMTDGSSAFVWRAEYRPFGGLWSNTVATVANNLRFPGQYFDLETGLNQNWFRDYSAKTGRYQEADPLGLFAGTNPMGYGRSSPANWTDSSGLWESDTHDWRTALWAAELGMSGAAALRIGHADAGVDSLSGGLSFLWPVGEPWRHFNWSQPGELDSRLYWANREMGSAMVSWKAGHCREAEEALGRGGHSIQDMEPHGNWDNVDDPFYTHWGEGVLGLGYMTDFVSDPHGGGFASFYDPTKDGRRVDNWFHSLVMTPWNNARTEANTKAYLKKFLDRIKQDPGKCGCRM